jgi:enoyl-CoA hydratase
MAEEKRVTTEQRGYVWLMGLNRVKKRNAFDPEMFRELSTAYTELDTRAELRCGILFAHGDHFTSGMDLMKTMPIIMEGAQIIPDNQVDPWGIYQRACSKPVICSLQGMCLTLGIELSLACDIRVAAENTKFAQIEIKRGIFPFGGGTIRMVQNMGWGNAMRYLLTGDEFTAQQALAMGMIQEVMPLGQQLERALVLADVIAEQSPLGVQATLRSSRTALEQGFHEAVGQLRPEIHRLLATEDVKEGLNSFLERRPAQFKGK